MKRLVVSLGLREPSGQRLNDLTLLFVLTGKVNNRHTWAEVASTQRGVGGFQK